MKDQFLNSFLRSVKKMVSKNKYKFIDRDKNVEFLKDRSLNLDHVKEAILQLSSKDKPKGPEEDRDGYPGYVFKFKSEYLTDEVIYIKIRFDPETDEVVCISFHDDE